MKALACEMCGSKDVIKQDGLFVCQSCGTKYSSEEAKKMMIDGIVTVKIDSSPELQNLYEIARRAKDDDNSENALKYYDMILIKDPGSWEANFYVVYFKAMSCKIAQIERAGISISNSIDSTFTLVKNNVTESEEQEKIIKELYLRSLLIAKMLYTGAKNHYEKTDPSIRSQYIQEYVDNAFASTEIMYVFGNSLIDVFGDTYGLVAADAWKQGIQMHNGFIKYLNDKEGNKNRILQYVDKIKKFDANYETPSIDTAPAGCYIATAVYGSYDSPEVWILRNYRDDTLAKTWYGRTFIMLYYAISPKLVKWFGDSKLFKHIWRKQLDKLIKVL